MGWRDYLFLTWLFGNKTRRERMIQGQNDNYLCNGCRTVVDPAAHICRACGSDLFTLKGKLLRGMLATVALVLLLIGVNPTSSRIYLVPGLIAFAICGYYQFTRPVHWYEPQPVPSQKRFQSVSAAISPLHNLGSKLSK